MVDWPSNMPDPDWNAVQIGAPEGAIIRTEMSSGPAKQRPRFTAAPRPVALQFGNVTEAVIAEFESFFEVDLQMGALDFQMAHPISGLIKRFRFVGTDEPYAITPVGKNAFQLNVSLELMP